MDPSSNSPPNPIPQNWLAFSLSNESQQLFQHPTFLFNSANTSGGQNKLEDFLGGPAAVAPPQYDGGAEQGIDLSSENVLMYDDLELKNIAASFLRGFNPNVQNDDIGKQLVAAPPPELPVKKAAENFGQRTSIFRGVTRHRWTGRYEAHLWDNSCRREGQSRKGRQVYLGGYDKEEKAARAYDLAALKYWGLTTTTNFPVSDYEKEVEEMKNMTRQEFVASLRKSSGFSRGASIYRGVTRHHQHGRWQARIGRVAGNKDLYLGTFSTQEEAAEAYDIAAIKFRGLNAVTNFDMSRYDVRSIASSNLPVGGLNNKPKTSSESLPESKSVDGTSLQTDDNLNKDITSATSAPFQSQDSVPSINFALPMKQDQTTSLWAALGYQNSVVTHNGVLNPYGTTPFGIELQHGLSNPNNADGSDSSNNENFSFLDGGVYQRTDSTNGARSGSGSDTLCVPFDGNVGATHEALTLGNGSWIAPPVHTFHAAKPNVSAFHTPIFGTE